MQSVGNTRRVSALRKKGKAEPLEGNPWGSGFLLFRRQEREEREGHEEGRCFFKDPAEAYPRGAKAQEGKGATPA
jgi:hypothetical protein